MSVIPFRREVAAPVVALIEPYYHADARTVPVRKLRPLTAIEQMYAYWGSDLVQEARRISDRNSRRPERCLSRPNPPRTQRR